MAELPIAEHRQDNDVALRVHAAAVCVSRHGHPYDPHWREQVVRIAAAASDKPLEAFRDFIGSRELKELAQIAPISTVSPPLREHAKVAVQGDPDEAREKRVRAQYEKAIKTLGKYATVSGIAQEIDKEEFVVRSYLRQHPDLGRRVLPD